MIQTQQTINKICQTPKNGSNVFKPRLKSWKNIDDAIQTQQIINKICQTPKMDIMCKTWELMKAVET